MVGVSRDHTGSLVDRTDVVRLPLVSRLVEYAADRTVGVLDLAPPKVPYRRFSLVRFGQFDVDLVALEVTGGSGGGLQSLGDDSSGRYDHWARDRASNYVWKAGRIMKMEARIRGE